MLNFVDKKDLFADRYQALIMPVPISGIFRHRSLLRFQSVYPEHYAIYKQLCEHGQLLLGENFVYESQRDLAGMGVGGSLSKPKFLVDMAITEFAENQPHLNHIEQCLQKLKHTLFQWGRYDGIRRVAMLASDDLILPNNCQFDDSILPLLEKYLQPVSSLNVMIYR